VNVGIDESGHERDVAEVDGFGASGMRDGGSGFDDLVALDEDFAGRDHASVRDIEQARGVKNDRMRRLGLGEGEERKE